MPPIFQWLKLPTITPAGTFIFVLVMLYALSGTDMAGLVQIGFAIFLVFQIYAGKKIANNEPANAAASTVSVTKVNQYHGRHKRLTLSNVSVFERTLPWSWENLFKPKIEQLELAMVTFKGEKKLVTNAEKLLSKLNIRLMRGVAVDGDHTISIQVSTADQWGIVFATLAKNDLVGLENILSSVPQEQYKFVLNHILPYVS